MPSGLTELLFWANRIAVRAHRTAVQAYGITVWNRRIVFRAHKTVVQAHRIVFRAHRLIRCFRTGLRLLALSPRGDRVTIRMTFQGRPRNDQDDAPGETA